MKPFRCLGKECETVSPYWGRVAPDETRLGIEVAVRFLILWLEHTIKDRISAREVNAEHGVPHATVWTFPSIFARAKYDPDDPFEIIFGWTPSAMASLTASTSLCVHPSDRPHTQPRCRKTAHMWKSSLRIGALWSSVLTCKQ